MTDASTQLSCVACARRYDANVVRYRCDCGDLLEVVLDVDAVGARGPALRARFDERLGRTTGVERSGVWRYRELILPALRDDEIVTLDEGNTPLYGGAVVGRAFGHEKLWLKHEGMNPTLSFKDRGMTAGVSWGRHVGATAVACASTGDTSAALAAYAARAGDLRAIVFLPRDKVSPEQLAQPLSAGALTLALDTDFDGCMTLVQDVCARENIYLLNSMNSLRIEGQKAIGIEAVHQLGWTPPDWFVIPVGNGGNVSALGKGLRELLDLGLIDRMPRIAGIQAAAADPLYRSYRTGFRERVTVTAGETLASAIRIGAPVSHPKAVKVIQDSGGVMAHADEAALMDAKARADRIGIAVCPNSGVALAGLMALRADGTIGPGESAVVILTAHGLKFSGSGVAYHTGTMPGLPAAHPNAPVNVDANIDAILDALR